MTLPAERIEGRILVVRRLSQNATTSARLKFSPVLPFAFTEHGAIMAASVLNSPGAIEASACVVRAFVKMRESPASTRELARRLLRSPGTSSRPAEGLLMFKETAKKYEQDEYGQA